MLASVISLHFTPVNSQWNRSGTINSVSATSNKRRAGQFHRQELVQRVELHELQAGVAEDLLAADDAEGLVHHAVGAAVAVVVGIAQQFVAPAQQAEVDAPGIDADAGDVVARLAGGGPQTLANVRPLSQQVPIQATGDLDGPFSKR